VHLLLALTSGEAREAGELAVHHQIAARPRVEKSPAAVVPIELAILSRGEAHPRPSKV